MHKCSKHQGPHAQVIHMDLDHVINSTAVIGNMKLQSQVTCWCYQHCCCNPKGFQSTVPILFQYLTKVFLWFSWLFNAMNLFLPHNPTFSQQQPPDKADPQPSLAQRAPFLSLGHWRCVETRRAPNGSTGSQKPDRRAPCPSQSFPVRLTWALGKVRSPLLSCRSRGGPAPGSSPHSFLQDISRDHYCPTQRWSRGLGWLCQMSKGHQ